ncbi:MAG TPA: hypothetical protein DD381_06210 [Lentisphaeria bacterium]|nr:MAG: hypothetical protein A2X47_05205 [Lentisphaerae bacterium GWF2_38_69]HBM15920.1 hypothetical protein [Lentisphaeria bacterium]
MSQELQGLLNRIQKEGVEAAEKQRDEILAAAKANAESIIQRTNMEAETILKTTRDEVKNIEERSKATIQQAARDILISLESELMKRMKRCVKATVSDAMTVQVMTEIITKMVDAFSKCPKGEVQLDLILSQKDIEGLSESIKSIIVKDLKINPKIIKGTDFSSGLKMGFNGSDIFFDFSDSTITELVCEYLNPKLSATLRGESK